MYVVAVFSKESSASLLFRLQSVFLSNFMVSFNINFSVIFFLPPREIVLTFDKTRATAYTEKYTNIITDEQKKENKDFKNIFIVIENHA